MKNLCKNLILIKLCFFLCFPLLNIWFLTPVKKKDDYKPIFVEIITLNITIKSLSHISEFRKRFVVVTLFTLGNCRRQSLAWSGPCRLLCSTWSKMLSAFGHDF